MEMLKQKLSSRKLWAAISSGVLCIVAACFGENLTPEMVDILKYAVVAGVAYIFGEGIVDAARQVTDKMGNLVDPEPETQDEDTTEDEDETNVVIGFNVD